MTTYCTPFDRRTKSAARAFLTLRRTSGLSARPTQKPLRLTVSSPDPIFDFLEMMIESIGSEETQASDFDESTDARWMREALSAACDAAARGEVPIGACVVSAEGLLLAVAGNRSRTDCDPTAHAEVVALREAARRAGNYRLTGAVMYATIEPCAMCAGALVHARIRRLVYGARDERAGAVESVFRVCDESSLNHRMDLTAGVLGEECREVVQHFFRARRRAEVGG
ncbi:MAG TPA: tRNA adenosine(34) deaminase TadA [Pyrinomonadaceae bacterium]|nr:tRNA adenosine(34) deaminase TadA [Pyrinomonadaceae bacterium]